MKIIRAFIGAILLASVPLAGAAALEAPVAIRPTFGVLIENLLDPANSSAIPSPSINFNLGCGIIMPFARDSNFKFEPSADFYYYNAEITPTGQALPTVEEYSSAFVLGLLLDAPVVFGMTFGKFNFGFGVGLCFDVRFAFTTDPSKAGNTPLMNQYYWDKARFVMPSTLIRAEYALTDRVGFGVTGRVLWPIYNLWTGEGFGFFDQSKYLVDLSIRYKLDGTPQANRASAPSAGDTPPAAAP